MLVAATKFKGSMQSRAKIVRDQTDGKEKEVFGFKFPTAKRLTIMLQKRSKKFRFKSPDHMRLDWSISECSRRPLQHNRPRCDENKAGVISHLHSSL
jgi:hypothetical protein